MYILIRINLNTTYFLLQTRFRITHILCLYILFITVEIRVLTNTSNTTDALENLCLIIEFHHYIILMTSKLIAVVLYTRCSASTSSPVIRSLTNTISKHTSTAMHKKYNIIILLTHERVNLYACVCVGVLRECAFETD